LTRSPAPSYAAGMSTKQKTILGLQWGALAWLNDIAVQ
jgi:hypothetical protein